MVQPDDELSFVIAIPSTRYSTLRPLLESISVVAEDRPKPIDTIVVDNTPAASLASMATATYRNVRISYVHEPAPGVVHARNAALNHFRARNHDFLAFVDDDQRLDGKWLSALRTQALANPDEVIAGRVKYVVPDDLKDRYVREYYGETRSWPEGTILPSIGTGNTAIPRSVLQRLQWPKFDERFNLIGGEDTEFYSRMSAAGVTIRWTNSIVAYEDVEPLRASRSWIRTRFRRTGLVRATIRRSRLRAGVDGVSRVAVGALRVVAISLWQGGRNHRGDAMFHSGLGFLSYCFRPPLPSVDWSRQQ